MHAALQEREQSSDRHNCKAERFPVAMQRMRMQSPKEWTFLPAFTFTQSDVVSATEMPAAKVRTVLEAFTLAPGA
jgi:hypothetical protein